MRYLKYKKRFRIQTILKISTACMLTVSVTFCVLKFFGNSISHIACSYISTQFFDSGNSYVKYANYENDFLNFLTYEEENEVKIEQTAPAPSVTNSSAIAVNLSAISGKYKNYGGTSVINNTKYNVSEILYDDYEKPKIDKQKPAVLIYHTHTSEEYYGGGSVVDVGKTITAEFEAMGYKTIHITDVFDKEQFSGAYSRSIKSVEKVLKENPSIKLVFDIHRDAITASNGDTYQPLTTVEGNKCAQVMFVCGTDEKGLSHPDWRENFKFALDVSREIGKTYGALSRPVNLRGDRFNTHTRKHSFLIEVGSEANTLDEAKNAAKYTVRSIISTINNQSS